VAGGICYVLWDRNHQGLCEVVNIQGTQRYVGTRALDEFPTLIRHTQAVPIIRKVL
jgi:site-specific DNA-methyltransferase (adenine-specific)